MQLMKEREANMISAAPPYQKQQRRVLGREMAYVDVGQGDPIVLLNGNPAPSYLWRNVLPHLESLGRCIAPDLIGMGDSDKLPNSGPGSYRFVEHRRYLDALLEALDVRELILPNAIMCKLSDEEMAEYRRPFVEPGEGRRPTLTGPRKTPRGGEPADVHAIATEYADWLGKSNVPKLFLKAEPGAIPNEIGRPIAAWIVR